MPKKMQPIIRLQRPKTKYNSTACCMDGLRFHSKAELAYYQELKLLKKAGVVDLILLQPAFHIPSNGIHKAEKYVCDFMVVYSDGLLEFVDVKGYETDAFKSKKKRIED